MRLLGCSFLFGVNRPLFGATFLRCLAFFGYSSPLFLVSGTSLGLRSRVLCMASRGLRVAVGNHCLRFGFWSQSTAFEAEGQAAAIHEWMVFRCGMSWPGVLDSRVWTFWDLSLCLSRSLSLYVSLSLSVAFCLSLSLSRALFLFLSLCLSLSLSLSFSFSVLHKYKLISRFHLTYIHVQRSDHSNARPYLKLQAYTCICIHIHTCACMSGYATQPRLSCCKDSPGLGDSSRGPSNAGDQGTGGRQTGPQGWYL